MIAPQIIERIPVHGGVARVRALCACGNVFVAIEDNVLRGKTASCGCLRRAMTVERNLKMAVHNGYKTAEYKSWTGMKSRTTNPNNGKWHLYGGRGITVCPEWRDSFPAFLAAVGLRPSPRHSIDRWPNRDGNYEPGNVRWATPEEQNNNRRPYSDAARAKISRAQSARRARERRYSK